MMEWWRERFEERARAGRAEPAWRAMDLHPALVGSLQRFQVGEDGDGASLIGKADVAGDPDYAAAVRLFVAEEREHARLLGRVLDCAEAQRLAGHWSDAAFVRLRRSLGLRLELMTLMVAEVVALRYYRALRDGAADPLLSGVAGAILADEEFHVPFHRVRLRAAFGGSPAAVRAVAAVGWWVLALGAAGVVAVDHGRALWVLGVSRVAFGRDVCRLFGPVAAEVLGGAAQGGRAAGRPVST
ncbi:hypothetical protein R8Z50_30725 [Longispora sp. K20-0274]|uniref:hypothetical protein n=1 Tax=Longispora sp. K20-0274 TaxID=3088255 RepID=UPI00399B6956